MGHGFFHPNHSIVSRVYLKNIEPVILHITIVQLLRSLFNRGMIRLSRFHRNSLFHRMVQLNRIANPFVYLIGTMNQAAKRWIENTSQDFQVHPITVLGDDLYSRQPVCEKVLSEGYNFIFTCKSSSHKHLYEWLEVYDDEDLNQFTLKVGTGKKREYHTYRFINDVPLKDGKDTLQVNWVELIIYDKDKNFKKRFCFVTNHKITKANVVSLVEAGRSRWKIENENNNTLKTKGYHLEHNFGHGSKNLSNFLMCLNLLAFLFHTVLELFDRRYLLLRKSLSSRKIFFNDIKGLTKYMHFGSWENLLLFMIRGLELEDPGG
jgi:hypothetical protein